MRLRGWGDIRAVPVCSLVDVRQLIPVCLHGEGARQQLRPLQKWVPPLSIQASDDRCKRELVAAWNACRSARPRGVPAQASERASASSSLRQEHKPAPEHGCSPARRAMTRAETG